LKAELGMKAKKEKKEKEDETSDAVCSLKVQNLHHEGEKI
jgi:hypothetical protein